MFRTIRRILPVVGLLAAAATVEAQTVTAYALSTNALGMQQLVRFNPNAPGTVTTVGNTGVNLTDIDFRPMTNVLHGYDGNRLYTIDINSGVATFIFDVENTSGMHGIDFNPVVDRLRIVDFTGNNYRVNQIVGGTTIDGAHVFAMGDVNFGRTPRLTSVAYMNSDNDPATGTMLFAIDPTLGQLIRLDNPNGGAISTVGTGLGIGSIASVTGFDIFGPSNLAYFSAILTGNVTNNLYSLDLTTGAARLVGGIPGNRVTGLALTAVPEPGTWALMVTGLIGLGGIARRRRQQQQS